MIELESKPLDEKVVGGKAKNLSLLLAMNLPIPQTLVIPVSDDPVAIEPVTKWLDKTLKARGRWRVAVRSSSVVEDSARESKAGHFLSVLDTFDKASLASAIARVRASGPQMAIILQPLIDAAYSGVAFSCNPLSFARSDIVVTWTKGLADKLVSHGIGGEVLMIKTPNFDSTGNWPSRPHLKRELANGVRRIEEAFGCPIDVEWVIDHQDKLWFVQARPVVLPLVPRARLDSEAVFALLPKVVQNHPKMRLRRTAVARGVRMAPAEIVGTQEGRLPDIEPKVDFPTAAGTSVVLLHPQRVNSEVVREFASRTSGLAEAFIEGCRRYAIRRYPRSSGITETAKDVLKIGLESSWTAVVIAQEIWSAYATGVVRKSDEGYIVEVALGHFVPKGVVPTSTIILSNRHEIVSKAWRTQSTVFHFIDGHVVTETPPTEQINLADETIVDLVQTFDPLFEDHRQASLEFGLVERAGRLFPYLIDVADEELDAGQMTTALIELGVISVGRSRGRLTRIDLDDQAIDRHLYDSPAKIKDLEEDIIVVAPHSSIDLLPYVGAPRVVGFVFEHGSVLGHLAVIMREKGIPGITISNKANFDCLPMGSVVELNATTSCKGPGQLIQRP